jgi:hypothetical protein
MFTPRQSRLKQAKTLSAEAGEALSLAAAELEGSSTAEIADEAQHGAVCQTRILQALDACVVLIALASLLALMMQWSRERADLEDYDCF